MIENIRQWLRTCPLISKDDVFNINHLEADTISYTIDNVPGITVLQSYLNGDSIRQKSFVIASRQEYSNDVLNNISATGFWDDFELWIENQNKLKNYPTMKAGQKIQSIYVTSSYYLYSTGPDTARYQIQITVTYYQKGER